MFEPETEVIRKGKAGKEHEFGKMLQVQEAENQIISAYEVYEKRPDDREILIAAVEEHKRRLGRTPRLVAADAGFSSAANERRCAGDMPGTRGGSWRRWEWRGCRFRITRRGTRSGEADRSKDGSSEDRSGAREWRGESAY